MTKSTITREQLEEWVAQFDEDGGCDATDRQLEALIRQSLAAMESESVAEVLSNRPDNDTSTIDRALPVGTQLYRHAQPVPVVPDGYVMVPKEPTEEMLQASYREAAVYSPTAYRAMIAAAPQEGKQ